MSKKWVRITQCQNIPLREGRSVRVGNRDIAVFNLGDRFLAVGNRCPHKGGPLSEGIVSGNTVICPLHAWKMSLETGKGVSAASASSCVQTYCTRVEDGVVSLELPPETEIEEMPGACIEQGEVISGRETNALASS